MNMHYLEELALSDEYNRLAHKLSALPLDELTAKRIEQSLADIAIRLDDIRETRYTQAREEQLIRDILGVR